jgi:hypothetical protein
VININQSIPGHGSFLQIVTDPFCNDGRHFPAALNKDVITVFEKISSAIAAANIWLDFLVINIQTMFNFSLNPQAICAKIKVVNAPVVLVFTADTFSRREFSATNVAGRPARIGLCADNCVWHGSIRLPMQNYAGRKFFPAQFAITAGGGFAVDFMAGEADANKGMRAGNIHGLEMVAGLTADGCGVGVHRLFTRGDGCLSLLDGDGWVWFAVTASPFLADDPSRFCSEIAKIFVCQNS